MLIFFVLLSELSLPLPWNTAGHSVNIEDMCKNTAGYSVNIEDMCKNTAGHSVNIEDMCKNTAGHSVNIEDMCKNTAGHSVNIEDMCKKAKINMSKNPSRATIYINTNTHTRKLIQCLLKHFAARWHHEFYLELVIYCHKCKKGNSRITNYYLESWL